MSYSIQINPESCSLYRSFVDLDVRQPVDMWENKTGVELQWTLPREPICETQADCEDGKNATCLPDPSSSDKSVKRCFCVDSFFWDPISGMCVQSLASGLGGAVLVSAVSIIVYIRHQCIHRRRERLKKEREESMNANNTSGRTTKSYTGREMKRATNNFSRNNLLGSGGFGEVYKGVLQDGTFIAVKCAKLGNTKSIDQVLNEVRILSQVSDFGLSRLIESEDLTHITTCAQGTLGYVDPEYYRNFQLTDKSDVYSFGVVLLEILTAQKAIDFRRPADDVNLAVYIVRLVEEQQLMEALDPAIMKIATQVEIDTMQAIGFLALMQRFLVANTPADSTIYEFQSLPMTSPLDFY
ncbi:Wall-associated receptor kinase-like 20 [Rhynchospora pubera]|uniref:Wall-associated receptor kinase-like 20 n=1 Tax=Rhynchospora pubera TaxID=906938 RepID=A0AAV8DN90_9POAL|nr:Wall-associated receptor kinase-like 20 [Rhynchospora pubera]